LIRMDMQQNARMIERHDDHDEPARDIDGR